MRILLTCQPVRSHFHSLAPVALAARRLGHTVGIAGGPRLEPLVRRLGFEFLPCGLDFDPAANVVMTMPGLNLPPDAPVVMRQLVGFSAGLGPPFARDLLAQGERWQPDLLVREPVEFAAPIAAACWGIPCASILWAIYINPNFMMRDAYAEVVRHFGIDAEALLAAFDRDLVIKYLPPQWRMPLPPEPPATRSFAARPFDRFGDERLPAWVDDLPDRPTLYATLGLTFSQAPALVRTLLAAVDGLPINAIFTLGSELNPAALGTLPANVHVERYIPGSLILPRCHAMLFHGGFNSLHAALWHGLPLVVIPQEAGDQGPTAELVAEQGLGLHVAGPSPEPATVRAAILRVLEEPAFADRARTLQAQMLSLPPLDAAFAHLQAIGAPPSTP